MKLHPKHFESDQQGERARELYAKSLADLEKAARLDSRPRESAQPWIEKAKQ